MKQLRNYQSKIITDIKSDINAGVKYIVMAMCPNAGKTFTSIKLIEQLLDEGKCKRVLILAHATTVLRSQYYESLVDESPTFTYGEITPDNRNSQAQVVVAIPNGLADLDLTGIDAVIVDEAHEHYLAPSVQKLLNKLNPKFTLLLTGTPSKFILENTKKPGQYKIHMVAMSDIPKEHMAEAHVFVCASKYDIKEEDYNVNEEVQGAYKFNKQDTEGTIDMFLEQMLKFLKMTDINTLDNLFPMAFSRLQKTMIACKSQQQAKQVHSYLTKKGVKSLVSTEETDKNSENIKTFTEDQSIKVLVVVNRGILGFNLPSLVNVVDMSGTRNLDRMYQLFSRITRTHESTKTKRYFKIAPAKEVEYTQYVTSAMLSLIHRDNISIYNGKNFKTDIPILVKRTERKSKGEKKGKSKGKTTQALHEFEGIDVIDVFTKVYSNLDKELQVYARTSLGEVRNYLGKGIRLPNGYWTLENCKKEALKYHGRNQWQNGNPSSYHTAKKNAWIDECCLHMKVQSRDLTFDMCRKSAKKYESRSEWLKNDQSAYAKANSRGWLDKCCLHMGVARNKRKSIRCIETGIQYKSIREASITIGRSSKSLREAISNGYKCAGLTFKYVEEGENDE